MYETLNYNVEDGIATICLDRADSANAMNPLMAKELNQVSLDVSQDESVNTVLNIVVQCFIHSFLPLVFF